MIIFLCDRFQFRAAKSAVRGIDWEQIMVSGSIFVEKLLKIDLPCTGQLEKIGG